MNDSGFLQLKYPGLIPMSSILLQIFFGVVPKAPTITGMIDTFTFHSFVSSLARSLYFSIFSTSFVFTIVS